MKDGNAELNNNVSKSELKRETEYRNPPPNYYKQCPCVRINIIEPVTTVTCN